MRSRSPSQLNFPLFYFFACPDGHTHVQYTHNTHTYTHTRTHAHTTRSRVLRPAATHRKANTVRRNKICIPCLCLSLILVNASCLIVHSSALHISDSKCANGAKKKRGKPGQRSKQISTSKPIQEIIRYRPIPLRLYAETEGGKKRGQAFFFFFLVLLLSRQVSSRITRMQESISLISQHIQTSPLLSQRPNSREAT
ncbi:hypothetical protein F4820DRAFT_369313 [Hypoxylon rubiginosum]|uniref:Uncharacterized protein n=1 Tax=Hypoxylon rubiginosum TaxID=110542 RepID=A0ACB9YXE1_9PEZI|nr:hypothetical protein F4820DRAFT_369313 [Hypoxylon rubiginosum]